MWLLTDFGFFSIVQKSSDASDDMLTIRARVRSDLESLRQRVMPELGSIKESRDTDYRFRARAPRSAVAKAMASVAEQIDYSNFKNAVSKNQGNKRAHLYHGVWDVLNRMQGDATYEADSPAKKARGV